MDPILNAAATILATVIGLWAVGRLGPMTRKTRPLDIGAVIAIAIGALGVAAHRVFGTVPDLWLIVILLGGAAWWLLGAPVTHSDKPKKKPAYRRRSLLR